MAVKVVCNQPYYFPLLHWWERALRGKMVILDDVLRSPTNPPNRALVHDGKANAYLTLPIPSTHRMAPINRLPIAGAWVENHANKLGAYYRRAPHGAAALELFHSFTALASGLDDVMTIVEKSITATTAFLGLDVPLHFSSRLGLDGTKRSARMILATQRLGGDTLVLGKGSLAYLAEDEPLYAAAGVRIEFQDWQCPVENRSVLDAIACHGRDRVRRIVTHDA
jgi:hypothetical protein